MPSVPHLDYRAQFTFAWGKAHGFFFSSPFFIMQNVGTALTHASCAGAVTQCPARHGAGREQAWHRQHVCSCYMSELGLKALRAKALACSSRSSYSKLLREKAEKNSLPLHIHPRICICKSFSKVLSRLSWFSSQSSVPSSF